MQESNMIGALDYEIVNGLQISPRIEWSDLARSLDVSPATLGRRWATLRDAGRAWVVPSPGPELPTYRAVAFALVKSLPGCLMKVAEAIARHPEAITVEVTAGTADLQLDLAARDMHALSEYLMETLGGVSGVSEVRTAFVTQLYQEASQWELRTLNPAQMKNLAGHRSRLNSEGIADRTLDRLDQELLGQLMVDGRRTWSELAASTGISPGTAKRRIDRLQKAGLMSFRCEVDAELADYPVSVSLLASVPPAQLDAARSMAQKLPECRLASAVTGPYSLFLNLWLPHLSHLPRVEAGMCSKIPELQVHDRLVAVRTIKRAGGLLDSRGRRTGVVGLSAW